MQTLKHTACAEGWVARPCCSWLSPGKATPIARGRHLIRNSCKKLKKKKKWKVKHVGAATLFFFFFLSSGMLVGGTFSPVATLNRAFLSSAFSFHFTSLFLIFFKLTPPWLVTGESSNTFYFLLGFDITATVSVESVFCNKYLSIYLSMYLSVCLSVFRHTYLPASRHYYGYSP